MKLPLGNFGEVDVMRAILLAIPVLLFGLQPAQAQPVSRGMAQCSASTTLFQAAVTQVARREARSC
ncbi:MAG: hypothetical protein V7661_08545 [Sulfitobacter sp.]